MEEPATPEQPAPALVKKRPAHVGAVVNLCRVCGERFITSYLRQVHCSAACRQRAYRTKKGRKK